jgi:glycosyltransferase involved in cell wall biosynthesis
MFKLISICIPTYNGEKVIAKTLYSLIENIEGAKISKEVEIILTDDCSSDSTFSILEEYAGKYEYIKIYKNENNLGMDGNFKQSALNADGEYIWYSGQDDIFLEDSVEYILRALKDNPGLGIVNINFSQYSEEKGKIICPSMFGLQSICPEKINFNQDLSFNNAKEYFSFFNDVPSFLPAIIMKRDYWLKTDNKAYLGTYFIQYATILLNLNDAKILAVTKPLIKGLIPSAGWQTNGNKLFSIQLGMMKARTLVFNDKRNPFPPEIYKEKKIFYMKRFLRIVIASRYYYFSPSKENKTDLKFIYGTSLYYLYFLPILWIIGVMPLFFIKGLFFAKRFITG